MCLSDAINSNAFGRTDVSSNKKSKWQTRKIEETKTIDMLAKSINPDISDRIKKIHPKTRMKWWMLKIAVPLILILFSSKIDSFFSRLFLLSWH